MNPSSLISSSEVLYVIFSSEGVARTGFQGFKLQFREVTSQGAGPPPIVGDNYGFPHANLHDDFLCNFNGNNACGMTERGLISDFQWKLGKGNSKSKNTGNQPDSNKPSSGRNGNISHL